jgi:hypothetical protein
MINEPVKVTNLKTLLQEKQRLKIYSSFQEELIKNKIKDIKYRTDQLIGEQFLPYELTVNKTINKILDTVNEYIFIKYLGLDLSGKNKLLGLIIKLSEVIFIRLLNLRSK